MATGWLLGAILTTCILGVIGHGAIWFHSINYLHATTWNHRLTHILTYLVFGILGVMPILWFLHTYDTIQAIPTLVRLTAMANRPFNTWDYLCLGYVCQIAPSLLTLFDIPHVHVACTSTWLGYNWGIICPFGAAAVSVWIIRPRLWRCLNRNIWRETTRERYICTNQSEIRESGSFWLRFPGCQSLQLEFIQRQIGPRINPTLSESSSPAGRSLRMLHLTDFHFGGGVPEAYYEWALSTLMERVQGELQPDLILLTGDFLDQDDWRMVLSRQLCRLTAPHGVWFVCGNHDFRVDTATLRKTLTEECGFIDLGEQTRRLTLPASTPSVKTSPTNAAKHDWHIELIGDEKPWGNEPKIWRNPLISTSNTSHESLDLRIVLTHTPDRFPTWARRFKTLVHQTNGTKHGSAFPIRQLVLAGHTHGGQMCIPGVGPVLTPCRSGVTFSDGVFQRDSTLLHVPHGIAAQNPLRLFCPPEAVLLEWTFPR